MSTNSRDEETSPARRPGRKRDASIDNRLMRAALECYARDGWVGFSFESVARQAKVGKPAVYLRWNSKEELLGGSIEQLSREFVATDYGSFREDLVSWARTLFAWWESVVGVTYARLQVEMKFYPELDPIYRERVSVPLSEAARQIVRRAVKRGEVEKSANGNLLLEVINGAVYTRVMSNPELLLDEPAREAFIRPLVALAVEGAGMDLSERQRPPRTRRGRQPLTDGQGSR
ncbi:TetR/AcrR family transcriptional regulator [Amycolatopsis sp. GM8]|uniref:TetR/AcrR family transcriptional regulator n=1 Tax=Amycolatopsis sp. GM8 TaxID=2896530 RepID=UPI001F3540F6|nr:TetR/AcrR family transcriptional regulator [Amycolatopsis sp. GM8]